MANETPWIIFDTILGCEVDPGRDSPNTHIDNFLYESCWLYVILTQQLFSISLQNFVWGALRVKISRGAPLLVQNGTQQDLNKMINLVNFGGQKDRLHAENGGLPNGTQQDLNKMVDRVKFGGGGGQKIVQMPKMRGKTAAHTYWLSKASRVWGGDPQLPEHRPLRGSNQVWHFRDVGSLPRILDGQWNTMRHCTLSGDSSPPSATYMHQWTESALVQIMVCHLFGAKPLSQPVLDYCQLDP